MSKKKIICIGKNYVIDHDRLSLRKKYKVINESESSYQLLDDRGGVYYYGKEYFKIANKKPKKAKKIKELRAFFNVSLDAINWCNEVTEQKFTVPQALIDMHNLHNIAFEEISKEKPSIKRVKFLISEMENLTQKTI